MLFSSYRVVKTLDWRFCQSSRHCCSKYAGCTIYYSVIVFFIADRGRLSEDEICSQLLYILDDAPCLSNPPPIGVLTGWKRSLWAEAREDLMKEDRNRRNLELITKSLIVICLDEPPPTSFNCRLPRGEYLKSSIYSSILHWPSD